MDVSLWDLRKALFQMSRSNASFLEWLGSPIVYSDDGILAALNALKAGCFNPVHVACHYASMFRKAIESRDSNGSISVKKLCYALRASICLKCTMSVEEMPPTPFAAVLERVSLAPDEREAIRDVLARKEVALESDVIVPDARLAHLLADGYDSTHPWRNGGMADNAYDKLEQLFRDRVKGAHAILTDATTHGFI